MNRTKKLHDDLQEFQFGMLPPKTNLFVTESPDGNLYDYYLVGEINYPGTEYIELMQCLRSMTPFETIVIHMNTPGGAVMAGEMIVSAMKDCAGYIVTSIEGDCCSYGTQIALNSDEVIVSDGSEFMIHNLSSWRATGNMANVLDQTAYLKSLNSHLIKLYDTFLTEEEKDRVQHGRDVTLFAEEVRKRLETFEYPRRKLREAMKEGCPEGEEPLDLCEMIEGAVKESVGDIGTLVNEAITKALSKYDLPIKQKPIRAKKVSTKVEVSNE